jgi:chloride channel 3/4/5
MMFDASQGWILSALTGFVVAVIAYTVNVTEATVFDFKDGYCARGWWINEKVRGALCVCCTAAPP